MFELPQSQESQELPPLTEKEVLRLIWKSFEFAQGDKIVQRNMLNRISSYYPEPAIIDADKLQKLFFEKVTTMHIPVPLTLDNETEEIRAKKNVHILAESKSHAMVTPSGMVSESSIQPYLECLTSKHFNESLPRTIAEQIWKLDCFYMVGNRRPNREASEKNLNTLRDPYFSFGVHYILRNNSASHPAYDRLLDELRAIPFEEYDPEAITLVNQVLHKYNDTHTQTPVPDEIVDHIRKLDLFDNF